MKRIFFGVMLLSLMTATTAYAGGGKKKSKSKAKTECCKMACKDMKDKKNCKPDNCPVKPGCEKVCK